MQKLVTIYFRDYPLGAAHDVQEHLTEFLSDGWEVVSMTPVGSSVGTGSGGDENQEEGCVKGWLAVLLRK